MVSSDEHPKQATSTAGSAGGPGGAAPPRRRKAILLVDDEVIVLKVGRRILERLGYEVMSTPRAQEALAVVDEHPLAPSLAIIDLIMPGMSGRDLLVELKKRYPATKVFVASGYAGGGPETDLSGLGCDGFIEKPFDMKTLESAVLEAIGPPDED